MYIGLCVDDLFFLCGKNAVCLNVYRRRSREHRNALQRITNEFVALGAEIYTKVLFTAMTDEYFTIMII